MLDNKNYLVTGAAGFIGSNFVRYMLEKYQNIKIISFDKLTYAGNLKNLSALKNEHNHEFVKGDICDKNLIDSILRKYNINHIIHFAAESHVDRSISGPAEFIQTNLFGTFQLLESARNYWLNEKKWSELNCRFHHISTDEVYGTLSKSDPAFTEKTAYAPNSPYSATKAGSDHLVRSYFHTYGLPVTTSNCSNNYGPYQHPEKLIPTVIRSCLQNKSIPVYGDGSNIRDWLFVVDHCSAIDSILLNGKIGETYNVGGKTELSNIQLVNLICELLDKLKPNKFKYSDLISFVKDRPGHDWRYAIDNSKIQTELEWKPSYEIKSGLEDTIRFYLSNGFCAE
ncbi:dTDP-glucose 4,6-dehydratase [Silvanigrella paludirubra]|uniref:dTDP-glucose 4,6-dehydratase n=1 Tax=Silvanigrella paludirubra TaxID=2499159 RepID=A0A6N6VQS1_9BACT|nr:dTDP-glucose 4,6-dehydratase [Silvanigrella paludirubra]KAB8037914.1 dTDP-glucose 4,6-dehydratase [Silvanigrella paludirubra]